MTPSPFEHLSYRGAMATTLLLIDVQRNMLEPPDPVPCAGRLLSVVGGLLERARAAGAAVVHVRHNGGPDEADCPGTPGWELYHAPVRGEAIVDKLELDAFAGTDLARLIPAGSVVVTAGLASDFCVRATVLSGLRQGYAMQLVRGGHGAYDDGRGRTGEQIEKEVERDLCEAGARIVEPRQPLFTAG
jgi:nicotinamidase-related amidase